MGFEFSCAKNSLQILKIQIILLNLKNFVIILIILILAFVCEIYTSSKLFY